MLTLSAVVALSRALAQGLLQQFSEEISRKRRLLMILLLHLGRCFCFFIFFRGVHWRYHWRKPFRLPWPASSRAFFAISVYRPYSFSSTSAM